MNPERRRRVVEKVFRLLWPDQISERRACRTLDQPRSTQRYRCNMPDADRQLIAQMRRLVESYPRFRASASAAVADWLACEFQSGTSQPEAGTHPGASETT